MLKKNGKVSVKKKRGSAPICPVTPSPLTACLLTNQPMNARQMTDYQMTTSLLTNRPINAWQMIDYQTTACQLTNQPMNAWQITDYQLTTCVVIASLNATRSAVDSLSIRHLEARTSFNFL